MPKYQVDIVEETIHRVEVEADNEEAAEKAGLDVHLNATTGSEFVACIDRRVEAKLLQEET